MSVITPGLMQIGSETNFFLAMADQIRLEEKQRAALEELFFEFQKYGVQRLADLDVADAEVQRLLTRESIDIEAVRGKVKEIEAIKADIKIREIESPLRAIKMLTHEQHLKIVTLVRQRPAPEVRTKST